MPLLMPALLTITLLAAPLNDAELKKVIEFRHWAHAHPELSNQEDDTAARIADELRALELEVHTGIAKTGVAGILKGAKSGPVVAVRADMDALPVKENSGLPFASDATATWQGETVPVAHACGHDIHMAVALGTATALAKKRDELAGTVMFIFQPAEEGVPPGEKGGADFMLEQGVFEIARPEAIFALHSFPSMTVGEIGYSAGPAFAATDHFILTVKGEQAHGAYPHLGKDTVVMSAEIVQALQTIRSRTLDPREPGVVTVGMIHGGERFNIIPGTVELQGTVRTYDQDVQGTIIERIKAIAGGITQAHGGDYELIYSMNTPAVINQPELAAWAGETLAKALEDISVREIEPTMGGEDFAYFSNEVPGFYFRLGTRKAGTESGGLHTPEFRADDSAIPVGIAAMSELVEKFLREKPDLPPVK